MRAIQRHDGKWIVIDANDIEVAGPFDTEEAALAWIEENTPEPPHPKFGRQQP